DRRSERIPAKPIRQRAGATTRCTTGNGGCRRGVRCSERPTKRSRNETSIRRLDAPTARRALRARAQSRRLASLVADLFSYQLVDPAPQLVDAFLQVFQVLMGGEVERAADMVEHVAEGVLPSCGDHKLLLTRCVNDSSLRTASWIVKGRRDPCERR